LTWINAEFRGLREAASPARYGRPLQRELGKMMVFGAAIVAMTVFLVTLFVVGWMTEHRVRKDEGLPG
jgi:hypothetical protein